MWPLNMSSILQEAKLSQVQLGNSRQRKGPWSQSRRGHWCLARGARGPEPRAPHSPASPTLPSAAPPGPPPGLRPLRWRPLRLGPPSQPLSPFSRKLITASVPVAAAKPASGQAAEAPAGERAVEGEGEPLSELRLDRFRFFLEDMIHRQPGS